MPPHPLLMCACIHIYIACTVCSTNYCVVNQSSPYHSKFVSSAPVHFATGSNEMTSNLYIKSILSHMTCRPSLSLPTDLTSTTISLNLGVKHCSDCTMSCTPRCHL